MDTNENDYFSTIARLRKAIDDRDSDIEKAAMFGKQLLEDKDKLTERIDHLLSENETLKQDKYSLVIDLETNVQTVNTQSSELTIQREEFDKLSSKFQVLQKESIRQAQVINNLANEKFDLEKSLEEVNHEINLLRKEIARLEQQARNYKHKADISANLSIIDDNIEEELDLNYYKMKNLQLQEALTALQCDFENTKLEENRLKSMVQSLEEGIIDRDKELKSYSTEIQKARDAASELQGEIELLKLEQVDVNRRGNSVFGELDDRRKLVEKEYKLLFNKYENTLQNFENNRKELSNCKGQIAILLSMTGRSYQDAYITRLENQIGNAKREIEHLTARLNKSVKMQQQANCNIPFKNDGYDYLRVMHQQAEQKAKSFEDDLMTLRLQNIAANDSLTGTQRLLYSTQDELNAMKLENMKLRQKVKELTVKPDEEIPKKREPKVEYLPWYKPNPENTTAAEETSSVKATPCTNKQTVIIDLGKVDERFQEMKLLKTDKTVLKESNSVATNDQSNKTSYSENIQKENEKFNFTPIKLKYKPLVKSKSDNCAQQ
ncbi:protein Spindly [Trichonephila clavipes]|nr:protein Spindly [Trichonephila clavipes]